MKNYFLRKTFYSFLAVLFFSNLALANLHLAPPVFKYRGLKAIFVDFIKANYEIVYDHSKGKNTVVSTITFLSDKVGHPIFDLVPDPVSVYLDNEFVRVSEIGLPENISKVRLVEKEIKPGLHTLKIVSSINHRIKYTPRGILNAFWIRDLKDRLFIEQYVPTNLEFDQYEMNFDVKVNSKNSHEIFANGEVTEVARNHIKVSYPSNYTASSPFFHLVPKSRFWRLKFYYKSIDGRTIPIRIYSQFRYRNYRLKKKTIEELNELEASFGPFPQDSILIYGTQLRGGMEYVGATTTSYVSLGHELFHSYFAKGVMPANGNSGWIDEGLASWRDNGYQTNPIPFYTSVNLAAHSPFKRNTDDRAYKYGRSFWSYVNFLLESANKPHLKEFLRSYLDKKMGHVITTQDMVMHLEAWSGMSFEDEFNQYIYGFQNKEEVTVPFKLSSIQVEENPHHHEYSEEELDSIL